MVELIVVITILLAISSILMPVLASARREAKRKTDSSNMHQLGLAAELYSQTSEQIAISPLDFRAQPEWASPIWSSGLDNYRQGFRNRVLEYLGRDHHQYEERIVPFKVSYLSVGDLFSDPGAKDFSKLQERQNAGWLVNFEGAGGLHENEPTSTFLEPYTRLNFDASVSHHPGQPIGQQFHLLWLFCNPSRQERKIDLK